MAVSACFSFVTAADLRFWSWRDISEVMLAIDATSNSNFFVSGGKYEGGG